MSTALNIPNEIRRSRWADGSGVHVSTALPDGAMPARDPGIKDDQIGIGTATHHHGAAIAQRDHPARIGAMDDGHMVGSAPALAPLG